ncbi:carbon storage regulator CsrA [Chloroflexi bacterium CFX6]|nr:carbon storage regulator CsrA [Chloroflexi bacterium CFX6]
MLVLTRKVDESIVIGDSIVVTVLAIEGEQIKIGIDAPRDVPILRQEVFDAVQDQAKIQELMAKEAKPDALEQLRTLLSSENDKHSEEPGRKNDAP